MLLSLRCLSYVRVSWTMSHGVRSFWMAGSELCWLEGALASPSMENMALAALALVFLAKSQTISLKLALNVHSLIWLLRPPEAGYQGPAIKALKSSIQKPPLSNPINMPN